MKVYVTQDDINKGKPTSMCNCPVARAIKRTIKNSMKVEVGENQICLISKDKNNLIRLKTPKKVGNFIDKFDSWQTALDEIKPFSFDLRIL